VDSIGWRLTDARKPRRPGVNKSLGGAREHTVLKWQVLIGELVAKMRAAFFFFYLTYFILFYLHLTLCLLVIERKEATKDGNFFMHSKLILLYQFTGIGPTGKEKGKYTKLKIKRVFSTECA
jgi:hypothetical protein